MATEPKSRRRKRKKILRKDNGAMFDASERRPITLTELREYVRGGGLFEARRHENGADCTYEVLQSVMGSGVLQNLVPGLGGGSLPGLGGLSALGKLGELANGAGGLAEVARVLGREGGDRGGWDDWDEPKRPRRPSDHRWDNPDFAEPPPGRARRDDPDWAADPDFE
jgi:hypothetical protein